MLSQQTDRAASAVARDGEKKKQEATFSDSKCFHSHSCCTHWTRRPQQTVILRLTSLNFFFFFFFFSILAASKRSRGKCSPAAEEDVFAYLNVKKPVRSRLWLALIVRETRGAAAGAAEALLPRRGRCIYQGEGCAGVGGLHSSRENPGNGIFSSTESHS